MAFNVLTGEFDDHTKNFSFLLRSPESRKPAMTGGCKWKFAPAYDLTGSDFPSEDPWSAQVGVHQLSVNGKRRDISDADLLSVADRYGIGTAKRILHEVRDALEMGG